MTIQENKIHSVSSISIRISKHSTFSFVLHYCWAEVGCQAVSQLTHRFEFFSFIFQCKPQLAIHWLKRNMKYIFKRNKSFVNEQKFAIFILINGFWTQTSILHFLYSFDLVSFRFRFGSFSFSLLWWTFFFFTFFFSFTIRRLFFFVVASEVQPILFAF